MNYEQLVRIMEANGISAEELAVILHGHFSHQIDLELCGVEIGLPADKEKVDQYHCIIDDLRKGMAE